MSGARRGSPVLFALVQKRAQAASRSDRCCTCRGRRRARSSSRGSRGCCSPGCVRVVGLRSRVRDRHMRSVVGHGGVRAEKGLAVIHVRSSRLEALDGGIALPTLAHVGLGLAVAPVSKKSDASTMTSGFPAPVHVADLDCRWRRSVGHAELAARVKNRAAKGRLSCAAGPERAEREVGRRHVEPLEHGSGRAIDHVGTPASWSPPTSWPSALMSTSGCHRGAPSRPCWRQPHVWPRRARAAARCRQARRRSFRSSGRVPVSPVPSGELMLRIREPSAPLSSKIVPALPPCSSVPMTMSCLPSPFMSPG